MCSMLGSRKVKPRRLRGFQCEMAGLGTKKMLRIGDMVCYGGLSMSNILPPVHAHMFFSKVEALLRNMESQP